MLVAFAADLVANILDAGADVAIRRAGPRLVRLGMGEELFPSNPAHAAHNDAKGNDEQSPEAPCGGSVRW